MIQEKNINNTIGTSPDQVETSQERQPLVLLVQRVPSEVTISPVKLLKIPMPPNHVRFPV